VACSTPSPVSSVQVELSLALEPNNKIRNANNFIDATIYISFFSVFTSSLSSGFPSNHPRDIQMDPVLHTWAKFFKAKYIYLNILIHKIPKRIISKNMNQKNWKIKIVS